MSDQFEWQSDIEDERDTREDDWSPGENRRHPVGLFVRFILEMVVFFGLLFGLWQVWQTLQPNPETTLIQPVQTVLDLEQKAVLNEDGELFLSLQVDDPAWISTQLRPENQAVTRAGLRATHAEQHEQYIWANVTWTTDGETRQRIAFFEYQDGHLLHIPTAPPSYWGPQWRKGYHWGALVYYGVDHDWTEDISTSVAETIDRVCATNCLEDRLPLTLVLAKDYGQTAATGHLRLPSPRLLALDKSGRPGPLFWQMLQQQIERYMTPANIRFAVPPLPSSDNRPLVDYGQAAADFMATHPEITVELINLQELPDNLAMLAANYDGAAVPPTQAMLAAGLVRDLTDFVNTDPTFDQADYYEQIWQGVRWRERIWWIPQAASMRLLFYDKAAYRLADRPEPSLHWTWTEMTQDITTLVTAQPEGRDLSWGFMDTGLDTTFSYAYNWNNRCTEPAAVLCSNPLQIQNVAAALDWYSQMAGQPGRMPDFTGLSPSDRNNLVWNMQGARRQAAIWADLPVLYEHHLLLAPIGVVPFPGSDDSDGITPLWVYGSFVSQQSERPLAVWQWLKFLSYQQPLVRMIPSRPSVAEEMGFWTNLPPQLGEAMRVAFPFARPVTIEEQSYLSWAQVTAVVSGELSPSEAAQQRSDIAWFGQD